MPPKPVQREPIQPPSSHAIRVQARSAHKQPRGLKGVLSLDDFEQRAKRHLPRQIYGYYSGAAETGLSREQNRTCFETLGFVPRILRDVSSRSTETSLWGKTYSLPIGICPMGMSGLATYRGDVVLARAAAVENIPMVVSATSITPLEIVASEGGARWFQLYQPGEADRIEAMVRRVSRAGYEVLVLTVDVPVQANRENNVRAGFSIPLKPGLRLFWDGLTHPRWSLGTFLRTLAGGVPRMDNMDAFRGPPILSKTVERMLGTRDSLDWSHVRLIRDLWPGKLVLKGILSADDAHLASERGIDALWLSNHGGRQLDGAIPALQALPQIRASAPGVKLFLDGGVRRGTDVAKALALGADFVFVGRPFLYAAATAGDAGVRHAVRILREEFDRDLALLGITCVDDLDEKAVTAFPLPIERLRQFQEPHRGNEPKSFNRRS